MLLWYNESRRFKMMKNNRLFRILYYILEKEKVTANELADKFEVSVRTIYRDIDSISGVGIPIYATQGKGRVVATTPCSSKSTNRFRRTCRKRYWQQKQNNLICCCSSLVSSRVQVSCPHEKLCRGRSLHREIVLENPAIIEYNQ